MKVKEELLRSPTGGYSFKGEAECGFGAMNLSKSPLKETHYL